MSLLRRRSALANRRPSSTGGKGNLWSMGGPCRQRSRAKSLRFEPLEERSLLSVGVSGVVWNDANQNGVRETGEQDVAGAVVEIHSSTDAQIGNSDDTLLGRAITDANGGFSFSDLPEGTNLYEVFRAGRFHVHADEPRQPCRRHRSERFVYGSLRSDRHGAQRGPDGSLRRIRLRFSDWHADAFAGSVATDAMGSVYVTGLFRNTVDFDPGPGTFNLTSLGQSDVFVAKYSSSGALVWARSLGAATAASVNAIATAADGSIYVTGAFSAAWATRRARSDLLARAKPTLLCPNSTLWETSCGRGALAGSAMTAVAASRSARTALSTLPAILSRHRSSAAAPIPILWTCRWQRRVHSEPRFGRRLRQRRFHGGNGR